MSEARPTAVQRVAPQRLARVWQCIWIAGFVVIAWLGLLLLPMVQVAPELDLSWAGALPYFAHRGFHFGTDIIFTYGPLGHFAGYAYTEYLATERTIWEFTIKALFAVLFCWALCELRLVVRVTLALSIILLLGAFEEAYAFAIVLTGLMLLRSSEQKPWLHFLLGLFLALLALVKFTYFLQGACAIGFTIAYYTVRRRWLPLITLSTSFSVALLSFWLLAGQPMSDLIRYVANSLEITSGYNEAMVTLTPSQAVIWIALGMSGLLVAQLALFWLQAEDRALVTLGSAFLILMLLLGWKHAFTRWENHALKFFVLFPHFLLASWLLSTGKNAVQKWTLPLTCAGIVFTLVGLETAERQSASGAVGRSLVQLHFAWRASTHFHQIDEYRGARLSDAKKAFSLPSITAFMKGRSVDVFGYRQGIALLNGWNYVPRPIFQSYSAYTHRLIEINRQHYRSTSRPDFVVSKLETIDQRFPTADDSGVLTELLYHYRPILTENGWGLWQAEDPAKPLQPQLITDISAKLNESVPLPDTPFLWAEIEIRQTRWGRFATFFHKSGLTFIEVQDDLGTSRYRIIPSMARSGFLLNPQIRDDEELAAAANGSPLRHHKWFRIVVEPGDEAWFKQTVGIRLFALPPPWHSVESTHEP